MKRIHLFILLLLILCLCGCSKNVQPFSKSGIYFDTVITITVYDQKDVSLLDTCFQMAKDYENLFSKTIEGSDIYCINHSNGVPVSVNEETFFLIEQSIKYASMTDGIIDPTILPLSDLWNFGVNENAPKDEEIKTALSYVDYHNISLDETSLTVTLKEETQGIDLGFIAKGYIADKMKDFLTTNNVTSGLINLGGNVLTIGSKPDGSSYTLGIKEPFGTANSSITTIQLKNKSLVTSGIYERYFYENDILYHHILDTKTGYPVDNDLLGVTILSDSSMEGDAYSTICMCLGLEKGISFIESLDNIEALFITKDNALHYSSGWPH